MAREVQQRPGRGGGMQGGGDAAALKQMLKPQTFASLAYRDFVFLWLGQLTHAGALWIDQIARPLLVLELTGGSAVHLGLIMFVRTLPALPLGLLAGVMADMFNRRRILLVVKSFVHIQTVVFVALIFTGALELWHIYFFTTLRGATMAFDQPARRALIPTVVPAHLVTNAMALSSGTMQLMRIAGAAGAGLLVAFTGFGVTYALVALFYLGAVLFTFLMRPADHERAGYQGAQVLFGDLVRGLQFAWTNPTVRGILFLALGYFIFAMAFMQVFAPLFATQVMGIGEEGFGYMMAVTGAGGLVGLLALATWNPTRKRGRIIPAMLALVGVLLGLFAFSTYLPWVVIPFAFVAIIGAAQSFFFPLTNAVLLEVSPENMRGRVIALLAMDRAVTGGGAAAAGFLVAAIGSQFALIIWGLAAIVLVIGMISLMPSLLRID